MASGASSVLMSSNSLENPGKLKNLVIGSGPGGATTAMTLAEAGEPVLVIEEGPRIPFEIGQWLGPEDFEKKYRNSGAAIAWGKYGHNYAEASVVGGGSEINAGIHHRLPFAVLEQWKDRFQFEASLSELVPCFEWVEAKLDVNASEPLSGGSLILKGWAESSGHPWVRPPTSFEFGRKVTLERLLRDLKIPVRSGFRAQRLRRFGRAWEVHGISESGKDMIVAENVFLCGGAIQTPHLLRHSGFRKNVGNSLSFHLFRKVLAQFESPIEPKTGSVALQVRPQEKLCIAASVSNPAQLRLAQLKCENPAFKSGSHLFERQALFHVFAQAESQGTVRSWPIFDSPWVRYSASSRDREALAEGEKILKEGLLAVGAQIVETVDKQTAYSLHLFSSCPAGENRALCATDSYGAVPDVPGLWIQDASILCSSPGVNPQGTIMALARRNTLKAVKKLGQ